MISISVEVARGAARYRVAVRTQSVGRALEIMGRQGAGREAKVAFTIDPESYSGRAEELEQGRRPERLWVPLVAANLGLCLVHAGIGIFVALGYY